MARRLTKHSSRLICEFPERIDEGNNSGPGA